MIRYLLHIGGGGSFGAVTTHLRTPPKSTYVFVRLFYNDEIKSIKIRPIDSLVTSALTPVMALDMAF